MRWFIICLAAVAMLLLAGCPDREEAEPAETLPISLLAFRYDAVRDVVIAVTRPLPTNTPVTPQRYADALAQLPETSYTPSATLRLAGPRPTVQDGVLTVNYTDAAGLDQLAAAQTASVLAALEAWWWVPTVREVRLLVNGQPVTTLGPLVITQPLTRTFHTFIVQPVTGEVGYLVGSQTPTSLASALALVQGREIRPLPAAQGFRPLLPPDTTIAIVDQVTNGVLTVNLSANFPRADVMRLAGLVLTFTQFPTVDAARFTFGGETVSAPFMRSNLNAAITPYDLLLPPAAGVASLEQDQAIQTTTRQTLGVQIRCTPSLVWKDLAFISTVPEDGAAAQCLVLQKREHGYIVLARGAVIPIAQLLQQGVSPEAVIAFRLPGWENLALTK